MGAQKEMTLVVLLLSTVDRRLPHGHVRPSGSNDSNRTSETVAPVSVRDAQAAGGARGRAGRWAGVVSHATRNSAAGCSARMAAAGGAGFCALVSGVVRCWHSAQSDVWTRTQSFPVVASTCENARALAASRSRRASAMETTVGTRSCRSAVTRHKERVRLVDRRMQEGYPVRPVHATMGVRANSVAVGTSLPRKRAGRG